MRNARAAGGRTSSGTVLLLETLGFAVGAEMGGKKEVTEEVLDKTGDRSVMMKGFRIVPFLAGVLPRIFCPCNQSYGAKTTLDPLEVARGSSASWAMRRLNICTHSSLTLHRTPTQGKKIRFDFIYSTFIHNSLSKQLCGNPDADFDP